MLNVCPLPRKGESIVYPCVSVCNQLPEFQSPSPLTVGRHCGKPFLSLSHHFFVCFPSAEHTEMIPIYKQNKTPILLLLSAVTALSWMVFTAHSSWGSLLLPSLSPYHLDGRHISLQSYPPYPHMPLDLSQWSEHLKYLSSLMSFHTSTPSLQHTDADSKSLLAGPCFR